jgi:hypothetical protein
MNQQSLFHETLTEALQDCIRALGGAKAVGHAMRPEKSIDDARRWLLDTLNPDRAEKLAPDQVLWILKESRKVGCHAAMAYIARECGYADPQPIEPEDERATLQREYIAAVKTLSAIQTRLERNGVHA